MESLRFSLNIVHYYFFPDNLAFLHRNYQSLFSNIRIYWQVNWPSIDDWDPPPLHFNLSHTSSLIACGVTVNSQVSSLTILSLSFLQ